MGWARGTQALAAIWDQRYLDAARHAEDGLVHVPAGTGAARLHAIHARALAAHGGTRTGPRRHDGRREGPRGRGRDELHDGVAGEFAFDEAKLWYYQALTLLDCRGSGQG